MIDREELAQHLHEAAWPGETAWLHQSGGVRVRFLRAADRALALIAQPEPVPVPKPKARQMVEHAGNLLRLMDDGSTWALLEKPTRWVRCDWPEASA